MSVLSPEATPDKALRIFATLVRDQEVGGSNPLAPTTSKPMSQAGHPLKFSNFMLLSLKRLQRVLVAKVANNWGDRIQAQSCRTIRGGISRPRVAVRHIGP